MNLPKFLVQRLGKEVVVAALKIQPSEFTENAHLTRMAPRTDYHSKRYGNSSAKVKSRKKWRDIKAGAVPPDTLYDLDDAIDRAGL